MVVALSFRGMIADRAVFSSVTSWSKIQLQMTTALTYEPAQTGRSISTGAGTDNNSKLKVAIIGGGGNIGSFLMKQFFQSEGYDSTHANLAVTSYDMDPRIHWNSSDSAHLQIQKKHSRSISTSELRLSLIHI